MTIARQPFLIRSENLSTDEFGALFSRMFGNLYSGLPRPQRKVAIAGVYGRYDGVSFRHLSFSGDDLISAMPDQDDEITFVFPITGKIVFNHAGETLGVPQLALAMEKSAVRSVAFLDGHSQYGFSVRRSIFARRLASLLEQPIMHKVCFQPMVDLNLESCQGIRAIIAMATGGEFDLLMQGGSQMPARLQEMLIDAVLEAWPHNYSDALKRPAPAVAPRHVKLAMEFLQEHPEALVSGSELAELANVSLRALQEGFRRFVGTSIGTYQRQVRLQRAYQALRQDGAQSVREISLGLGFTNVGRFCQYFQSAFGLSPAELRRSRG